LYSDKGGFMIIPWVVTTSDDYLHLMPEFAARFNEFVGAYKIDVLCFEKPPALPKNFNIISLGRQKDFGRLFTDPVIPYFKKMKSEFFFHVLDDYMITNYMNHDLLQEIFDYCSGKNIKLSKVDFHFTVQTRGHTGITNKILLSDEDVAYRSSLQAACWRTEYWRKLLVPGRNIWQFEKAGSRECMNDGAFIFGSNKKNKILRYHNASHLGRMKKFKNLSSSPSKKDNEPEEGKLYEIKYIKKQTKKKRKKRKLLKRRRA